MHPSYTVSEPWILSSQDENIKRETPSPPPPRQILELTSSHSLHLDTDHLEIANIYQRCNRFKSKEKMHPPRCRTWISSSPWSQGVVTRHTSGFRPITPPFYPPLHFSFYEIFIIRVAPFRSLSLTSLQPPHPCIPLSGNQPRLLGRPFSAPSCKIPYRDVFNCHKKASRRRGQPVSFLEFHLKEIAALAKVRPV